MAKDYYKILNVDRNFTDDNVLKKAWRKACVKYHPDKYANKSEAEQKEAEERIKEINEAYECLSDKDKRAYYDSTGSMEGYGQGWQAGSGFGDFHSFFRNFDFGDMFGFRQPNFGNRKRQQVMPGQSLKITLKVPIEEIFKGGKRKLKYTRKVRCSHCNGEGGSGVTTCPKCGGTGMLMTEQRTNFGRVQNMSTCPYCHGAGEVVSNKCTHCNGTGFTPIKEDIEIQIPAYVQHGYTTRLSGKGCESKSMGAPNGDLIVTFVYDYDQSRYAINEQGDVYERIAVPYYDCILGTTMKRTLPNGSTVDVTIDAGANEETQIVLKNKGLRNHNYIFIVAPYIPKTVSKDERKYLEKIQKLHK